MIAGPDPLSVESGLARRLVGLRRALRSPLPHGLPGRTLDKTLIIARWAPGNGFSGTPEMLPLMAPLAAEILAAADLTIVAGGGVRLAEKPDWLHRFDWTPVAPHPMTDMGIALSDNTLSLWFDARRIAMTGPLGGNFLGFSVSGVPFCLVTEGMIAAKAGGAHPILLGPAGTSGFVVPEELTDLPANNTIAFRPMRRELQILAAGRFLPDLPDFGEHAWAALEIDFRDQRLEAIAEKAPPIAFRPESTSNDSLPSDILPAQPLTQRAEERPPPARDDFLTALKALFFGK